jgi:hypothetical protein
MAFFFDGKQDWADELNDDEPYYEQVRIIRLQQTPYKICKG